MLVLPSVVMRREVLSSNPSSQLNIYLKLIHFRRYARKALNFKMNLWFLMLVFIGTLKLNPNRSIILWCVSLQWENHIAIQSISSSIIPSIALKVLILSISTMKNKTLKYSSISMQSSKTIKSTLATWLISPLIPQKSNLKDKHLHVITVPKLTIKLKFIVWLNKHIFVMIVIKRSIHQVWEKSIIREKYQRNLKNSVIVQNIKIIHWSCTVTSVTRHYVWIVR